MLRRSSAAIGTALLVASMAAPSSAAAAAKPIVTASDTRALEASGVAAVRFSLTRRARRAVRFRVTPVAGSAGAADADLSPRRAVIRRGRRRVVVRIPVSNDALDEDVERFDLLVSRGARLRPGRPPVPVRITDDDPPPTLSIGDAPPVPEGTGAPTSALRFAVTLSAPSGRAVSVTVTESHPDLAAQSAGVTIAPGATVSTPVDMAVAPDSTDEPDEQATVGLVNARAATVTDGQGAGTILDDDPPPVAAVSASSITEGDSGSQQLEVRVRLSAQSEKPVAVTVGADELPDEDPTPEDRRATAGACGAGGDFEGFSDRVVEIPPGQTRGATSVTICGDQEAEHSERFALRALSAVNADVSAVFDSVSIVADDGPPPAG